MDFPFEIEFCSVTLQTTHQTSYVPWGEVGMGEAFENPGKSTPSEFPGNFRALVTREVLALGYQVIRWADDGLDVQRGEEKEVYIGLSNVYRRVKTHETSESEGIVRQFLQHLLGQNGIMGKMPERLEEIRFRLLPRIGQPFKETQGITPWTKRLPGTQLALNLVIDFPQSMAYVNGELMDQSETPAGDWLDIALENLMDRTPVEWLELAMPDMGIYCGHLNDSYDAARALILPRLQDAGAAGWLIAIPARDWLFAMKVEVPAIAHLPGFKNLTMKFFEQQPYPISEEIFWVRHEKPWVHFPLCFTDDTVQITPPVEILPYLGFTESELTEGDQDPKATTE
jgi:hypothetical protein